MRVQFGSLHGGATHLPETIARGVQVAIVGSGPAGIAAAVHAARRGLSHVLIERGQLAGAICRYRRHKHVMAEPSLMELRHDLAIDFRAGSREAVLDQLQEAVIRNGVQLLQGPEYELLDLEGERGQFELRLRGGARIRAETVILAIGTAGSLRTFDVPGDHLPHVCYGVQDPMAWADARCTVVGAGDSAIEEALELLACDADVTLVNRGHGFPRAKAQNRTRIEAAIARGHIRALRAAHVLRIAPGGLNVEIKSPVRLEADTQLWIPSDLIVGCLGGQPPMGFFEHLKLDFDVSPSSQELVPRLSSNLESSRPGVYLIGEVAGCALIKPCLNQGYEIIGRLLGQPVPSPHLSLLKQALGPLGIDPARVVEDVRTRTPLFRSLSHSQIESLLVASRAHAVAAGTSIYDRGDFGETLFVVLDGAVELHPGTLTASDPAQTRAEVLASGDFFGAGTVLSGRPRLEGARALRDSRLIEIPALELRRIMCTNADLSRGLNEAAARSAIADVFPVISFRERERLAAAATVERHEPGAVLLREGDKVDALYILIRGAAAVSRQRDGADRIINHIRAGECIGESSLVHPSRECTSTVKSTVLSETLRIPADVITALPHYPALQIMFRIRWHSQIAADERVLERAEHDVIDFVIANGGEATDLLVIDEELCIRCDNCERACAETHGGVSRLKREAGPRYAGVHLPTACQHCENASCMNDCPPRALQRDPHGEVYILDSCIGCGNCADACPYDVIVMQAGVSDARPSNPLWQLLFGGPARSTAAHVSARTYEGQHELAVKCDLCREVPGVRSGERSVACAASCPTGAIARRSSEAFLHELMNRTPTR